MTLNFRHLKNTLYIIFNRKQFCHRIITTNLPRNIMCLSTLLCNLMCIIAIFDLLLEGRADINSKDHCSRCHLLRWDIPIFAAAQSMFKNGEEFCQNVYTNHVAHSFRRKRLRGLTYLYLRLYTIYTFRLSWYNKSWAATQALAPSNNSHWSLIMVRYWNSLRSLTILRMTHCVVSVS